MGSEHAWDALTPAEAREVFASFGRPWWVAGGWAIDLHLGRETRAHEDIDLAIVRGDEVAMREMLGDWDVCIAHAGELTPWSGGAPLAMPYHQFWVRREAGGPWSFEVLLEDHAPRADSAGTWRYRRDHRVTMPLARFGRVSADGIPYVAPEIALLYKAKGHEIEKNAADFASAAGSLDAEGRAWLRSALEVVDAGHPWLAELV